MKPDPPSSSEQQQYDDDASSVASPSGSAFQPSFNLENRILKGSESTDNHRLADSDTIDQEQQQNAHVPDQDYFVDGPEIVRAPSDEFRNPGLTAAAIFLVCLLYTLLDFHLYGPLCTLIMRTHAKCCYSAAERKLIAINDEAGVPTAAGDLRSSSAESTVVSAAAPSQIAQLQYVAYANAGAKTTAENRR